MHAYRGFHAWGRCGVPIRTTQNVKEFENAERFLGRLVARERHQHHHAVRIIIPLPLPST